MKKPFKIAILIDYLNAGGVQKAAIQETQYLKKLGLKTTLVVLAKSKDTLKIPDTINVEYLYKSYPWVIKKNFKVPTFRFLSLHHFLAPLFAPRTIKKGKYDLILSHGTTTTFTAYTLKKFQKIPYITFVHDPMAYILEKVYTKSPLGFFLPITKIILTNIEKILIKSAACCILDSKVHEKHIKNLYGVKPEIVNLSVDIPKTLTKKKFPKKILSFGRWDVGKQPQILLDLILKMPKEVDLTIAGNWTIPEDLAWFKNQIAEKKLTKRVQLLTSFNQKGLQELAAKSFVWVHPHFEAFSLSALEATSLKLPIVLPQGSGVTELFQNGKHGFFVKNASVSELKKPIFWLFQNPQKAQKMGQEAAKIVEKHFSPNMRSSKLKNLIEKSLETKTKIIALECAHVGKVVTAGGDLLLAEMVKRMENTPDLTVVLSQIATSHWENLKFAKLIPLPKNYFEKFTNPFLIFINYLIKSFQGFFILKRLTNSNQRYIIYSSTDSPPDVLPIYFLKLLNPSLLWIARVHHIFPPPAKRSGNYFVNFFAKLMQDLALLAAKNKADVTIALNQNIQNEIVKKGFIREKTTVIQAGVNLKAIERTKPNKTKYDAVYLGRIHKIKGVFDLVPIWQLVLDQYPNAKLAIIGSGSKNSVLKLQKQIKKSKLEKHIFYLGYLHDKDVYSQLKSSKLFLFTDHEAGFGLAAAQALACGLPIVGWDIGILGKVFQKGFKVAPLSNYLEFARQITQLFKNTYEYQQLKNAALLESKKHTWEKVAKDFEKLLSKL